MHHPTAVTSPSGTIEASVLIAGTPQKLYRRADGRMFAPGVPGSAYALRVRNLTGTRVEVIATVDGRHVLKDEPGDPHACRGMVIHARGTYEFRGWRVSDDESREFLFGEPAASVAAQSTGSTANIGVIGLAAWRERDPWPSTYPLASSGYGGGGAGGFATRSMNPVATASAGAPVSANAAMDSAGSLGTGIGASQDDRVGRTDFTRTGEPDILIVGYDTEAELIRRGILGPADPDPFPGVLTGYEKYATS
jgi:hypothetical protein